MAGSELLASIKKSHLGEYLNDQELEMILKHNKVVSFTNGDIILKQGRIVEGLYIIIEGNVIVTAKLLGEGTTTLETLDQGHILGEISFIEKVPNATSVIANNNVKCLLISKIYFELLSAYFPETRYKIFRAINKQVCERLKRMHDKIISVISRSDMSEQSIFTEIIHSLAKPEEISFEEGYINVLQLQTLGSLGEFTANEIDELFKHGVLLKAEKNCILIHKKEHSPSCYIVIHGAVQSSVVHENKIAKLSIIGPSTLFASISCLDKNTDFTITFAAREPAVLFKFSESDLTYFENNYPLLWYKLYALICRSLVVLEKSMDKLDIRLNIETYNR